MYLRRCNFLRIHKRLVVMQKLKCTAVSTVAQRSKVVSASYVVLETNNGSFITVRALLDPGAWESFSSERVVQCGHFLTQALKNRFSLNLLYRKNSQTMALFCALVALRPLSRYHGSRYFLKSKHGSEFCFDFSALVLGKILADQRRVQPAPKRTAFSTLKSVHASFKKEWFRVHLMRESLLSISIFKEIMSGSLRFEQVCESHLPTTMHLAVQEDLPFASTQF